MRDDRDALSRFILGVPYPPAPERPVDNVMTDQARAGFFEFSFINNSGETTGAQTCGSCHLPPFLVSTNTPGNRHGRADLARRLRPLDDAAPGDASTSST